MKQRVIACDVDGVLADLVNQLLLQLRFDGHSYMESDIRNFDFSKTFSEKAMKRATEIMGSPGFCQDLPWYTGGRVFLSTLKDLGDVVIATAPFDSATWSHERRRWLEPHIHKNDILSVPSKRKHLAVQFADVLIEDRAETLGDWKRVRPDGLGILINRPWNWSAPCTGGIYRVTSYRQAIETIRERA